MQPNLAAALVLFTLLLIALLQWRRAVPLTEAGPSSGWPRAREPDEEQPGTDRAGRNLWPVGLSAAVALVAVLRVALLMTLHA